MTLEDKIDRNLYELYRRLRIDAGMSNAVSIFLCLAYRDNTLSLEDRVLVKGLKGATNADNYVILYHADLNNLSYRLRDI